MTDSRFSQSIGSILGDKAARPARIAAVPTPEEPETPVESETDETEADPAPRQSSRPRQQQRPSATASTKPRVSVMLPADLFERLATERVEQRSSYRVLILRAVDQAYAEEAFERLLAEHRRAQAAEDTGGGGLFGSLAPKPMPAPKQLIEFRPEHGDMRTLDQLWRKVGAKDRTEFLIVALEHYFARAAAE